MTFMYLHMYQYITTNLKFAMAILKNMVSNEI